MGPIEIVILALVFLAVLLAVVGIWLLVSGRGTMDSRVRERLQGVRQVVQDYNLGESLARAEDRKKKSQQERREVIRRRAFSDIPALEEKFGSTPWVERLNARLRQAQMPLTVFTFMLLCAGCAVLGAVATALWLKEFHPIITPAGALALGAAPYIYLMMNVGVRMKRFSLQFPDALDLLSSCVKSGLSLNAAIQNVADELPDPVADEFRIMADELTFGEDLSKVLGHFRQRVDTEDVQVFCTALQLQRETGGNLSEVLDGLQKTIRERFRILRQVKSLTAQGRLSGWIVGGLPIGLGVVIYLFNPAYISQLFSPLGKKLLFVAVAFQFMGMLMIRKIVNIKV